MLNSKLHHVQPDLDYRNPIYFSDRYMSDGISTADSINFFQSAEIHKVCVLINSTACCEAEA